MLETPEGTFVNESGFIAEFACTYAPDQGLKLWPHEKAAPGNVEASAETVKHKLKMQKFDKLLDMGTFWGAYMKYYKDEESFNKLKEKLPQLEQYMIDNLEGKDFLGGDEPMYIDIHVVGLVERLTFLEGSVWNEAYEKLEVKETLIESAKWVERM